jgi:hypothetical protein
MAISTAYWSFFESDCPGLDLFSFLQFEVFVLYFDNLQLAHWVSRPNFSLTSSFNR